MRMSGGCGSGGKMNANGSVGASASEGATRIAKAMQYKRSSVAIAATAAAGAATATAGGSNGSTPGPAATSEAFGQEEGSNISKQDSKAEAGKKV